MAPRTLNAILEEDKELLILLVIAMMLDDDDLMLTIMAMILACYQDDDEYIAVNPVTRKRRTETSQNRKQGVKKSRKI